MHRNGRRLNAFKCGGSSVLGWSGWTRLVFLGRHLVTRVPPVGPGLERRQAVDHNLAGVHDLFIYRVDKVHGRSRSSNPRLPCSSQGTVASLSAGLAQVFQVEKFDIKGDGGTGYVVIESATGRCSSRVKSANHRSRMQLPGVTKGITAASGASRKRRYPKPPPSVASSLPSVRA